jgi:hypothetical protein
VLQRRLAVLRLRRGDRQTGLLEAVHHLVDLDRGDRLRRDRVAERVERDAALILVLVHERIDDALKLPA